MLHLVGGQQLLPLGLDRLGSDDTVQPLNQFWLRVKALFKGSARVKDTDGPKESGKQELIARDLSPARDAIGGASKGRLDAKPGQNRPREIDFMNDGDG